MMAKFFVKVLANGFVPRDNQPNIPGSQQTFGDGLITGHCPHHWAVTKCLPDKHYSMTENMPASRVVARGMMREDAR